MARNLTLVLNAKSLQIRCHLAKRQSSGMFKQRKFASTLPWKPSTHATKLTHPKQPNNPQNEIELN